MFLNMNLFTGILRVRALLKQINTDKELLILEIEQGNTVKVPKSLRQDVFPMSFRYYDPILKIIM